MRSLRCGPGSARTPGRSPGSGRFVSVERGTARAPPPQWLWCWCSVLVGRRPAATPPLSPSDQHCRGVQLPEPWRSTAAHAPAWHTVVAPVVAEQYPRAARWPRPQGHTKKKSNAKIKHGLWWLWSERDHDNPCVYPDQLTSASNHGDHVPVNMTPRLCTSVRGQKKLPRDSRREHSENRPRR